MRNIFIAAASLALLACDQTQDLAKDPPAGQGAAAGAGGTSTGAGGTTSQGGKSAGIGAGGSNASTGGNGIGVGGSTSSTGGNGIGVGGSSSSTGGNGIGVGGSSSSTGGNGIGVGGNATGGNGVGTGGNGTAGDSSSVGGNGIGAGGSDTGGGSAVGGSGTGGNGTGGGPADSCPPSTLKGALTTMLDQSSMTSLGPVIEDVRVGGANLYVLSDPWVYFASYSGAAPLVSTLPLNENVRQLAVIAGSQTIPPSWQTSDKLLAQFFPDQGETVFALKSKDGILQSDGEGLPGLVADGTDVAWALRAPARVVEAELGAGGMERVLADYPDGSGLGPIALAIDASYIYWTTGNINPGTPDPPGTGKLYRAGRHGASAAEEISSFLWAVDQILVDGDKLHVAYARGTSDHVGATLDKSGKVLAEWGSHTPVTFRISRLAVIGTELYWTEFQNGDCSGRLVRRDMTVQSQQLDLPEPLIDNLRYPGNLIERQGTLYFTTPADFNGLGGGVYSYVPPAPGASCHGCGSIYANGASPPICKTAEAPYNSLLVCMAMSCFNDCQASFLDASVVMSPACKSCVEGACPTEVSVCKADADG